MSDGIPEALFEHDLVERGSLHPTFGGTAQSEASGRSGTVNSSPQAFPFETMSGKRDLLSESRYPPP